MSKAIRQENLYGAEDWTVIYSSFKNAEFKSYDFDTLRQSMVEYMQVNYAEEFNDYIQNSEFIALLDLVAFTGQNIAFRMDLNARENILDTAEKRESVLRIARMLSYKPKRVRPAQGLLKIVSVTTTAQLFDSTGNNLANQIITWGSDPSELEYERFVRILNDALNILNPIGTPVQRVSDNESGIVYETYDFDNTNPMINVTLGAGTGADGLDLPFEVVPITLDEDGLISQKEPDNYSSFSMLYRNDGKGVGSARTGFFLLAKQGYTVTETRTIQSPQVNLVLDITNTANISEDDFYVQTVDSNNNILTSWDRVSALDLTNIVSNNSSYGSDLFEVLYTDADVTSIKFGDGDFSNAPSGNIRIWYRIAQNDYVRVKAGEISGTNIEIDYKDENGNNQTVFLKLELQENMITGLPAESVDEIRNNAPEAFYSKNRMVTADDYNGFLATLNNDIMLMKAENRTFSGHTRYVDLRDPTGKSRPLVEFGDDGYLYREENKKISYVADGTTSRLVDLLSEYVERQLSDVGLLNFYYGKLDILNSGNSNTFPTIKLGETIYKTYTTAAINEYSDVSTLPVESLNTSDPYDSFDIDGGMLKINNEVFTYTKIVVNQFIGVSRAQQGTTPKAHPVGSTVIKMNDIRWRVAYNDLNSSNGYFSQSNTDVTPLQLGYATGGALRNLRPGALIKLENSDGTYDWTSVLEVNGDGLGYEDIDGTYTGILRNGDGPVELSKSIVEPRLLKEILPAFPRVFDDQTKLQLVKFLEDRKSFAVGYDNIRNIWTIIDPLVVDLDDTSDYDSSVAGKSWLISVKRAVNGWDVISRQLDYIFGSKNLIRFYNINFLPSFNTNIKNISNDDISVMTIDTNKKLKLLQKYRITGYYVYDDGYTDSSKVKVSPLDFDGDFLPDDPESFIDVAGSSTLNLVNYDEGDFSYLVPEEGGEEIVKTVPGTDGLVFKWNHVTPSDQTLNPSLTNIIDVYVLTKTYNEDFISWKKKNNRLIDMPLPPTAEELRGNFKDLSTFKMMTDEVIFHPAKFKPLFGILSSPEFQAQFKVVKNPKSRITDNEIKSRVITAIDEFFKPGNFDFGENFYFTDLAAYIHNQLDTDLHSVVIVPTSSDGRFGTLFQVQPDRDEVVTSVATVNDIIVINEITDNNIRIGR